jgi:hypothetical protein
VLGVGRKWTPNTPGVEGISVEGKVQGYGLPLLVSADHISYYYGNRGYAGGYLCQDSVAEKFKQLAHGIKGPGIFFRHRPSSLGRGVAIVIFQRLFHMPQGCQAAQNRLILADEYVKIIALTGSNSQGCESRRLKDI